MSTTYSQMIHCHHNGGGGRGGAKIVVNIQRDRVNVTRNKMFTTGGSGQ